MAQGATAGTGRALSEERLKRVQDNIVELLSIASRVADRLSHLEGDADGSIKKDCTEFLERVLASQEEVKSLAAELTPGQPLEQTVYHALAGALATAEKARVMAGLLTEVRDAAANAREIGTLGRQGVGMEQQDVLESPAVVAAADPALPDEEAPMQE